MDEYAVTLARPAESPSWDVVDVLRTLVVATCALAMVFAGHPLPF